MKRHGTWVMLLALSSPALLAGCWGESKDTSLHVGTVTTPAMVGSAQCTNTCHAATVDILGEAIASTWTNTTHTVDFGVQCEDCHGGGGGHWGVGPIPYPNPSFATCAAAACHGGATPSTLGFDNTKHANGNHIPDGSFSQIATSVSFGRHIEECSVCHNPNQRFAFDGSGNMLKPVSGALPNPSVTCGSCHDGHQPAAFTTSVMQRANAKVYYPRFRNFLVDSATGAQADNSLGTQVNLTSFNLIFQPDGAVKADGSVDNASVEAGDGKSNELHPDRLCAACHAQGTYRSSGGATHQTDVYAQWRNSGHGDRTAAAFGEFSANPPVYNANFDLGHQVSYPYDMKQGSTTGGSGRVGSTATSNRNAGNDVYRCFKCHNGLASIDYQDDVQGTDNAHVIFGDATVTCITCHDPHTDVPGQTKNTRRPKVMTKYTATQVTFSGNVFLDNTPVDLTKTGNGTICVFCHQGRESGFTVYKVRNFATAVNDNLAGASFTNPHYLGAGAMLWGKNAYEYSGKFYSNNEAHQGANCPTCHMKNATADAQNGGHTWNPNFVTCNTASCHGGTALPAVDNDGTASPDPDVYRMASDANNYTGLAGGTTQPIAESIKTLQDNVIALLAAQGIYYDDTAYPYFHNVPITVADGDKTNHASTTAFSDWTKKTYRAAFNLQFIVKGLPTAGTSTTYVVNGGGVRVPATSQTLTPNASAAVHNHKYVIQLLRDAIEDLTGTAPPGVRPAGNLRPATAYGTGQ